MEDTEDEPLTPPNTGLLSKDEMRPFVAGTADEIVPFATSLVVDGESPEDARKRLWWIAVDVGSFDESRVALYRRVAAGIVLLALDERVRGEEVVARVMVAIDERGIY